MAFWKKALKVTGIVLATFCVIKGVEHRKGVCKTVKEGYGALKNDFNKFNGSGSTVSNQAQAGPRPKFNR